MDKKKTPNFFIVGAPKCGTTALSRYLASHPDIYMSETSGIKEPGFFAHDACDVFGQRPITTEDAYYALFDKVGNQNWQGEASVNYLASKSAIPAILDKIEKPFFVIAIRNPLEMAQSMHAERVKQGNENILGFEDAWHAQELRSRGEGMPAYTNLSPMGFQYGSLSSLGTQLKEALNIIPKEQVQVVVYDDLREDPLYEYKKILNFLDINYDGRVSFERVNERKVVKFPIFLKSVSFANTVRRHLGIPGFGKNLYKRVYQMGLGKGRNDLRLEFKQELVDYFRDEINILSRILDRDFDHWMT